MLEGCGAALSQRLTPEIAWATEHAIAGAPGATDDAVAPGVRVRVTRMRLAFLFGAVLFVGSLWGACAPPFIGNVKCTGNGKKCTCTDGPQCAFDCGGNGCDVDCHNIDECNASCGDACNWDCHDADVCDGVCGDGCRADCHNTSACQLDCGIDCKLDCHDTASCQVRMISGEVKCHNASACDIQCALPGGGFGPAENFKKDHWRCK